MVIPYRGDVKWVKELKVCGDLGQVVFLVSRHTLYIRHLYYRKFSIYSAFVFMPYLYTLPPSKNFKGFGPPDNLLLLVVVASFAEIKTGYRGFETIQNLVFCMVVLCIENYLQAYMSDNL